MSDALRRALCPALLFALAALGVAAGPRSPAAAESPKISVDEDCPAFAFSPDSSRIIFSVQHLVKSKRLEMERDDLWEITLEGKRRRLVNGEKLVQGPGAFSYTIHAIRWSPDGHRITLEMRTSQMVDASSGVREGVLTDLMDSEGKEIKVQGADSALDGAVQAAWLGDGVTVVYLKEAVQPGLEFTIEAVRPVAGRGSALFEGRPFTATAWDARHSEGVAIERDPKLEGPIQLLWLDLQKQTVRELASPEHFAGHLTLSPSASKIAYFVDGDTLEVREVAHPETPQRVKAAYGVYQWAADERRILLKRGPERQSGELLWVNLADGSMQPLLHDLLFHNFELSPDGHWVAVTLPGKRRLQVYPLQ